MERLSRLIRFLIPAMLLLASLGLYFGQVKALSISNKERSTSLLEKNRALLSFIHEKGFHPTPETLYQLQLSEKELSQALEEVMKAPAREMAVSTGDLESIHKEWGYTKSDPHYIQVAALQEKLKKVMEGGGEKKADDICRFLAFSFCSAGISNVEEVEYLPREEGVPSPSPYLGSFDLNIIFNAGLTEAVEFTEEWILLSGGGFLIQPLALTIQRLEPGQWTGDLKEYTGPPARFELKARILFTIGKG